MGDNKKSKHRQALDAAMSRDDYEEYDRISSGSKLPKGSRVVQSPTIVREAPSNQDLSFDRHMESQRAAAREEYDKKLKLVREQLGDKHFDQRGEQLLGALPVKSYMDTYREMSDGERLRARDSVRFKEQRAALPAGEYMGRGWAAPESSDSMGRMGRSVRQSTGAGEFMDRLAGGGTFSSQTPGQNIYSSQRSAAQSLADAADIAERTGPLDPEEQSKLQSLLRRSKGMR